MDIYHYSWRQRLSCQTFDSYILVSFDVVLVKNHEVKMLIRLKPLDSNMLSHPMNSVISFIVV